MSAVRHSSPLSRPRAAAMVGQRRQAVLALGLAATLAAGCTPPAPPRATPAVEQGDSAGPGGAPAAAPLGETWDLVRIQGQAAGYAHTVRQPPDAAGRERWTTAQQLDLRRFGQSTRIRIEIEQVDGPLVRPESFRCFVQTGPQPIVTTVALDEAEARLRTEVGDRVSERTLPRDRLPPGSGPLGLERSLLARPLSPGEKRNLVVWDPVAGEPVERRLEAFDWESVERPGGPRQLLRITDRQHIGGQPVEATLWMDPAGEILEARSELLGITTSRSTRVECLAALEGEEPDVGRMSFIRLDRELPLFGARRIRFRLRSPEPLAAEWESRSQPRQRVQAIDGQTIELDCLAAWASDRQRPTEPAASAVAAPADLASSRFVVADSPAVRALADQAAQGLTDPGEVAVAMERFVHDYIQERDYSQAFAASEDVIVTRRGDCTEHAVLLAALARARGIPARAVIGLIYTTAEGRPGFGFHMWNEVLVDGAWMPLDATLGRGGVTAAHIAVLETSLGGDGAMGDFVPVSRLLGRLQIEVLAVEE